MSKAHHTATTLFRFKSFKRKRIIDCEGKADFTKEEVLTAGMWQTAVKDLVEHRSNTP